MTRTPVSTSEVSGPVDGGPVHGRLDVGDASADLLGREVLVGEVGGVDDAQDGIPRRGDALTRGAQAGDGAGHARALAGYRGLGQSRHAPIIGSGRLSPCAHSPS